MKRRVLLAGAAMLPLGLPVRAQEASPSRPITMIVPFPPGGVADITGRPTAHVMGKLLKQSVVVQNKGGAGGSVGTAQAARSAPDGYTILMALSSISVLPVADRLQGRTPAHDRIARRRWPRDRDTHRLSRRAGLQVLPRQGRGTAEDRRGAYRQGA